MSNSTTKELHLQHLYNEKIENIMKHIESEKKTLKKFHKGTYEKTDKTKNVLTEDMRKNLFQNISKELIEKNEKMKNQFINNNNMYTENEPRNLEMDISKFNFNYPTYNTHTFLKASNPNRSFKNAQGSKSHLNQGQFQYDLYKKYSKPIMNHPILVHNGIPRGMPHEPIQKNEYRKSMIEIIEEENKAKDMINLEKPPIAKEAFIPLKKKCNTDISGLIHAYKEYKEQEEKKEKEMEKSKMEERKMCNRKIVHNHRQEETCKIKEEMFSNEDKEKQIIKERNKEEIKKDSLLNEIMIHPANYMQVPSHMKARYDFACTDKNHLSQKLNENIWEHKSNEIIKNTNANIWIEKGRVEKKIIPNKYNIYNPKERSMSGKTFFDTMEKHKKEMNFNQMNFNYVQNNNVDIHINHGYPSNQPRKGKTNIQEMKYVNIDLLEEGRNLYEQPIHENLSYDELAYRHNMEMKKKMNQRNYGKYTNNISNDGRHFNQWLDSNLSLLGSKEKASECLSNDNSSQGSYKTYNTIVYNNELKRAYLQREIDKSVFSNKSFSEEENPRNTQEQFSSCYSIASVVSNHSLKNLKKKEMTHGVNRKREEINFLSNNDLSSFDVVTDKTNIIDQGEQTNYNDILCLDIEEKKTNKLFFEEICVYRMNERSDSHHFNHATPIYLFKDKSLNELALEKLEIHKKHYKDINDEIKKLIPQEDVYEVEMNVGLLFRKFVPVTMSLSCKYLLIQKNENNLITCISYRNITKIEMVKKNDTKRIYLFKLVYIFKKKKEKTEKNVTLLFRTNKSEMFDKIKNKVHPLLMLDNPEKDFLDIETVYTYIIQKYKTVHALYLKHLLQNVEKIIKKNVYRQCFNVLKMKYVQSKKAEQISIKKKKKLQEGFIKMENCLKKIGKKHFQLFIMKSYEHSLVNYQVKTNNLLYEMLTKEKTVYQENLEKQNTFLLCSILSVFYKKKMRDYFDHFTKNSRILHRGKEAFVYVITHVNSIFSKYENRNKKYVLNLLRFDYDKVSHFSSALYKLYLRRVLVGYLGIRDNQKRRKFLTQKHVLHLVKVLTKVVDHMKHYAFTKIQKHVYEEKERKNVLLLDSLVSANNELCNNLDKVAIEKGINKIECLYKFKIKECLVKFFFKLRGPQINNGSFSHCLKNCSIFIFVLNKIAYRKIQKHFFHFILKCLQDNNTNRLIYSMKKWETVLEKKEKRNVLELLKFYEEYPYLFKYRHLTKIEVFINSVTNFIVIYNRKLMLNFFLKLHYIKYQGQVIKAYTCIGNIYKFVKILNQKMHDQLLEPFEKLVLNAREKRFKMLEEQCKEKKNKINSLNKISFKDNKNVYKKMNYSSDDISPDGYKFMKKYPLLFHNSNLASEYTTTLTDDKWSMKSNDSIAHSLSHTYDDMDQIKKKICSFNTKISKMK